MARNTDERTAIAAIIPWGAASYGWIISTGPTSAQLALLEAAFNSFAYDYILRNSLTQPSIPQSTSEQIPVPSPDSLNPYTEFIALRVLELTYTAHDMAPFARDLGDTGAPFRWDESRRALLRAELDAAFFHLYGVAREDADYIMDTFPILKRKDEAAHGTFRTKDMILQVYDAMAEAARAHAPYETAISPPPGQGPRHPARPTTRLPSPTASE